MLNAWRAGDSEAGQEVIARIYPQLRRLAGEQLVRSGAEISLQATELVHELYLELVGKRQVSWQNRAHFFAIASRLMRNILVDHARRRLSLKRGGRTVLVDLHTVPLIPAEAPAADLLNLDRALEQLETVSESALRVVELRYFGGLSLEETAEVLGVARSTVIRTWRFARAWLTRALAAPRHHAS